MSHERLQEVGELEEQEAEEKRIEGANEHVQHRMHAQVQAWQANEEADGDASEKSRLAEVGVLRAVELEEEQAQQGEWDARGGHGVRRRKAVLWKRQSWSRISG